MVFQPAIDLWYYFSLRLLMEAAPTCFPLLASLLDSPIEYLKGVGPQRGDLLRKELNIHTFGDLLEHFPYRHVDKTRILPIAALQPGMEQALVQGTIVSVEEVPGNRGARRFTAWLRDNTGSLELTWFQGIGFAKKVASEGKQCLVFGKLSWFKNRPQMVHPELETAETEESGPRDYLDPVYPTTEKLKQRYIHGRTIGQFTKNLLAQLSPSDIPEFLPPALLHRLGLKERYAAYHHIHFPPDSAAWNAAIHRLKFEELFLLQLRANQVKIRRHHASRGHRFAEVGQYFLDYYHHHLPFELTGAQKRVIREIRADCGGGHQMNRLLQGDVGSGKTMVALLSMLLAVDNGYQACLMAPTEILAQQHHQGISALLEPLGLEVGLLTGSTKTAERRRLLQLAGDGALPILIGTHALIEDTVQFANLGLAVIDEQHRFGVEQRARLWEKNEVPPHILVMTATPIPRTLSMSIYGDLDISIIDELPPGRKPVQTVHRYESSRFNVLDFVKMQLEQGRQAYIIFPLIEESEKVNLEDLMKGYEHIKTFFPEPKYWISMLHGRMSADEKETNMRRFVKGETQIMVATTVIEVGVNVPNASVMVIESAEKFGLSQLHQLRGRVGRGADQSYCVLLTGNKLTNDARERLKIMEATNDGFRISEKDLELRGPGDLEGTRQSGVMNFKLASVVADKELMEQAANMAAQLLEEDTELELPEHAGLKHMLLNRKNKTLWGKIS